MLLAITALEGSYQDWNTAHSHHVSIAQTGGYLCAYVPKIPGHNTAGIETKYFPYNYNVEFIFIPIVHPP